jgi:hypothetical protein
MVKVLGGTILIKERKNENSRYIPKCIYNKSNTELVSRNLASSLLTVSWEMGGLVGCLALRSAAKTQGDYLRNL